jgi:hypothetical protein
LSKLAPAAEAVSHSKQSLIEAIAEHAASEQAAWKIIRMLPTHLPRLQNSCLSTGQEANIAKAAEPSPGHSRTKEGPEKSEHHGGCSETSATEWYYAQPATYAPENARRQQSAMGSN